MDRPRPRCRARCARLQTTGSGFPSRRHRDRLAQRARVSSRAVETPNATAPPKNPAPEGPAKARPRTDPPRPPTSTVLLARTARCAGFRGRNPTDTVLTASSHAVQTDTDWDYLMPLSVAPFRYSQEGDYTLPRNLGPPKPFLKTRRNCSYERDEPGHDTAR